MCLSRVRCKQNGNADDSGVDSFPSFFPPLTTLLQAAFMLYDSLKSQQHSNSCVVLPQVVKPEDDDFQEFQDASKSGSLDDSFTDFQGEAAKAASSQHRSRYQVLGVSVISLATA